MRGRVLAASGFGLLEAIVALAILASTGLALFAWIQQSMQTAARLSAVDQQARLLLLAQNLVVPVNPSERLDGEILLDTVHLKWSAELVEPVRTNLSYAGTAPGPWLMGLYRLKVRASDKATGAAVEFEQLKVGTKRSIRREQAK